MQACYRRTVVYLIGGDLHHHRANLTASVRRLRAVVQNPDTIFTKTDHMQTYYPV